MADFVEVSEVLDGLFADGRPVVGSADIAQAFGIAQADVSAAAGDLGIPKLGASYVFDREDAQAVIEEFDFESDEDDFDQEDDFED